jgi:hypothetical protein
MIIGTQSLHKLVINQISFFHADTVKETRISFLQNVFVLVCTVNSAVQYENVNGYWLINYLFLLFVLFIVFVYWCFCLFEYCLLFFDLFVYLFFVGYMTKTFCRNDIRVSLTVSAWKKDIWFITSLCKMYVIIKKKQKRICNSSIASFPTICYNIFPLYKQTYIRKIEDTKRGNQKQ